MTRKSVKSNDGSSQSETRDYMRLKTLIEEFIARDCRDYDDTLDDVFVDISKTGIVRMPWKLLKPLILYKLDKCLSESFDSSKSEQEMEKKLKNMLDTFEGPPFTIQRLCELLLDPLKHYKRKDRYMRALEKNLLVISTQEPDLVWMKVPKLSQLLEVKPKPVLEDPPGLTSSDTMLVVKEPVMRESSIRGTPPHTPPGSPARVIQRSSPRSLTPPLDPDIGGRGWDGFAAMETRLSHEPYFPRKRSSSFRSNGGGGGGSSGREEEVELQEADSTVSDPLMSHDLATVAKKPCSDESDEAAIIGVLMGKVEGNVKPKKEVKHEESSAESRDSHMTSAITPPTTLSSPASPPQSSEGDSTHSEEMEVN